MSDEIKINSVWRVSDKRFERYVTIVGFPRPGVVEIGNCSKTGERFSSRTTKAKHERFGKAYKLVTDIPTLQEKGEGT